MNKVEWICCYGLFMNHAMVKYTTITKGYPLPTLGAHVLRHFSYHSPKRWRHLHVGMIRNKEETPLFGEPHLLRGSTNEGGFSLGEDGRSSRRIEKGMHLPFLYDAEELSGTGVIFTQ